MTFANMAACILEAALVPFVAARDVIGGAAALLDWMVAP